jgi:hypothetical protein
MLRFFFILFALSYFFVRSSFAEEALYFGIHQQFMSVRAMGMGNAHVAVANDENAIFYNPAGTLRSPDRKMNFFLKAGGDPDIADFMDDISKAQDAADSSAAIADVLVSKYGEHYSLRAPSLGFIWATPKWSLAFIPADVTVEMGLNQSVGPAINLVAYQDTTLAYSRAWNVKKVKYGRLDMGSTAKLIYRGHLDKIVDIASIQNDKIIEASDSNEGMTLDFDLGMLWTAPEYSSGFWSYMQPTVGLNVRNLLDYGYFANMGLYSDDKNGDPDKLHRVIDVGTAFKLPKWWLWSTQLAIDVRDILHPNWTIEKGFHAGLEFNWEMFSWWKGGWRVGMNQMYWTAGFTGQLWLFRLDLTTFGREIGTSSTKKEDRVYMLNASIDF